LLLPAQRQRAVPWSGREIIAIVLLTEIFTRALTRQVLLFTGFFTRLYGPDFVPSLQTGDEGEASRLTLLRFTHWEYVVSFPFRLTLILLVLSVVSGTLPYQLGLTARRLGRDILVGILTWIAVTPLVLLLNYVVTQLWQHSVAPPGQHPLTQLTLSQPLPFEWVLIFLSAVVAAPVYEELLFRGVFQAWATARPHGGDILVMASVLPALLAFGSSNIQSGFPEGWRAALAGLAPGIFVFVAAACYGMLRRRFPSQVVAGLFGSALLFGAAHSTVWPTPVSLFVLGLALGAVAFRTQSLVPSTVAHSLFNAVGFGMLLFPQLAPQPEKGNDTTEACLCVPADSTCSTVPGSE
jgi:membrane protease YdiL (CAAX protease family)